MVWRCVDRRCDGALCLTAAEDAMARKRKKLGEILQEWETVTDSQIQQALGIAKQIGNTKPNIFISVNAGINTMQDAYAGLAAVASAQQRPAEENRWQGEAGVLTIARQDLFGAIQRYVKLIDEQPPTSIGDLLQEEAEQVAHTMLGAALSPTAEPKQPVRAKQTQPRQEEPPVEQEDPPADQQDAPAE